MLYVYWMNQNFSSGLIGFMHSMNQWSSNHSILKTIEEFKKTMNELKFGKWIFSFLFYLTTNDWDRNFETIGSVEWDQVGFIALWRIPFVTKNKISRALGPICTPCEFLVICILSNRRSNQTRVNAWMK